MEECFLTQYVSRMLSLSDKNRSCPTWVDSLSRKVMPVETTPISMNPLDQETLDNFPMYLQHERWTRQQMLNYQADALRACREYAYTHSPFYQRFHRGLMDRPLQELPVLTKAMLMDNFDDLVTDRAVRLHEVQQYLDQADASKPFLDRYRIMATSGSSGRPGYFLSNWAELAALTNSGTRFQHWAGVTPESRIAVVASGAPGHMTSQFPFVINGKRLIPLQLSSMEPLETLVRRLNEWQPDTVLAYPAITSTLAEEQRQGRLRIAPRAISYAGERMPSDMRQRIEETWQTKLFQVYASTEGGGIASECELHQGMHLFEDFSIVEVVDQDNRPVPPGEQGARVLLTVLYRRTQPLIRYEISDVVRTSTITRCPCGRPFALIESIQGRTADMLYLPSPSGREEGITALQFETVIDMLPVTGWQVVQEHDGLHILLTGAPAELRDEDVRDKLSKVLSKRGVIVPDIQIERVTALIRNISGKAPMLISHVPPRAS
jgi:phenylacetate-CoA ligase